MSDHCPACGTELVDDAYRFWCPAEERAVPYSEVAAADDAGSDYEWEAVHGGE